MVRGSTFSFFSNRILKITVLEHFFFSSEKIRVKKERKQVWWGEFVTFVLANHTLGCRPTSKMFHGAISYLILFFMNMCNKNEYCQAYTCQKMKKTKFFYSVGILILLFEMTKFFYLRKTTLRRGQIVASDSTDLFTMKKLWKVLKWTIFSLIYYN